MGAYCSRSLVAAAALQPQPAPKSPYPTTPSPSTAHPPFANPLPHDAQDVSQVWPRGTFQDSAAVLVYADHGIQTYVLMARRAPWLSSAGTWSVFMGSVERTDLDSSGAISFARAAEHELFEESVTVYHQTDANGTFLRFLLYF